jgi:hypothetical protein
MQIIHFFTKILDFLQKKNYKLFFYYKMTYSYFKSVFLFSLLTLLNPLSTWGDKDFHQALEELKDQIPEEAETLAGAQQWHRDTNLDLLQLEPMVLLDHLDAWINWGYYFLNSATRVETDIRNALCQERQRLSNLDHQLTDAEHLLEGIQNNNRSHAFSKEGAHETFGFQQYIQGLRQHRNETDKKMLQKEQLLKALHETILTPLRTRISKLMIMQENQRAYIENVILPITNEWIPQQFAIRGLVEQQINAQRESALNTGLYKAQPEGRPSLIYMTLFDIYPIVRLALMPILIQLPVVYQSRLNHLP